jgi:hypothetical protein
VVAKFLSIAAGKKGQLSTPPNTIRDLSCHASSGITASNPTNLPLPSTRQDSPNVLLRGEKRGKQSHQTM